MPEASAHAQGQAASRPIGADAGQPGRLHACLLPTTRAAAWMLARRRTACSVARRLEGNIFANEFSAGGADEINTRPARRRSQDHRS